MLQEIRSKASSFVVKVLFGLLILTFGIWGIGDIFRSRGADNTVATVGDRTITVEQLSREVQSDIDRLRPAYGGTLDAAQAKQLHVVDDALKRLITIALVELEINRMGLAIGDDAVRDAIVGNENFRGRNGQFDRNVYTQVLASNRMSEPQFETGLRLDLLRVQLLTALTGGMLPPQEVVSTIYRTRNEQRVADFVLLPASEAGPIAPPSEEQIAEYYRAHEDSFRNPERRGFTVATAILDDIAAGIEVSDDQLKQEYETRRDEFRTPEQRHVLQLLLPDEATAKEAASQLAAGKDFETVAKDVAKTDDVGSLDLGWVARADLPPELGDAAFALEQGAASAPVKSTFGWHVLKVVEAKAATEASFDEAKEKLKIEVTRDRAGDRLADLANQIDDALAGGASFDDVAQKFGLKLTPLSDVDADGNGSDGAPAALPQPRDPVLRAAFATASGQTSPLTEVGNEGYFLVHIDKVTPATTKPLAEVHDDAAQHWLDEQRRAALLKVADAMVEEVNAGKSLKDVATAHGLTARTTTPLQRLGGDARLPASLVAKLFDTKQGAAVSDASGSSVIVAQLNSIERADPMKDQSGVQQLTRQVSGGMQDDMLGELDQAWRRNFPVHIEQSSVDRIL